MSTPEAAPPRATTLQSPFATAKQEAEATGRSVGDVLADRRAAPFVIRESRATTPLDQLRACAIGEAPMHGHLTATDAAKAYITILENEIARLRAPLAAHPATTPEPMGSGPTFNEATEAQDRMERDAEVAAMREAWSASHPDTLDRMTIRGDGEYIVALQRIIGRLCSTIEGICEFGPLPPDLHARAPDQAERAERAIAFLRASLSPSRESGALLDDDWIAAIRRALRIPRALTTEESAELGRYLSTLERDAARMREALEWMREVNASVGEALADTPAEVVAPMFFADRIRSLRCTPGDK